MRLTVLAFAVTLSIVLIEQCHGHGYLATPPGRGSAWRQGFPTPKNYDDNGQFCGGRTVQHTDNGGKCGVCGDNYASTEKPHEPGPGNVYATGTIVAEYYRGQTIDVTVMITAFHKGYFEFKLCKNDVPQKGDSRSVAVTQECFELNHLSSNNGSSRFMASYGSSTHKVKLPADVVCDACILQWRYRTGNNWGCEYIDDEQYCGEGYGPQEEFWNCADIKILDDDIPPTVTEKTTTTTEPNEKTTKQPSRTTTITSSTSPQTWTPSSTQRSSTTSTTQEPVIQTRDSDCYGVMDSSLDSWCTANCALGFCPPSMCWCYGDPLPTIKECQGYGVWNGMLDDWCDANCNHLPPYCPESHCSCTDIIYTPPN